MDVSSSFFTRWQETMEFVQRWIKCNPGKVLFDTHEFLISIYAFHEKALPPPKDSTIETALSDLWELPIHKPQNMFEEFIRRREVLVRCILYDTPGERFSLTSLGPSPLGNPQYSCSLLDLFSPCLRSETFPNVRVRLPLLDRYITRYTLPPRPANANVSNIYAPQNPFEAGVDSLMFFDVVDEESGGRRICVGIQNKWSDDELQKLYTLHIASAYVQYVATMKARLWREEDLYFVVIARRRVAFSPGHPLPPKTIIISLNTDNLQLWLGPMMYRYCCALSSLSSRETLQTIDASPDDEELQSFSEERSKLFQDLTARFKTSRGPTIL